MNDVLTSVTIILGLLAFMFKDTRPKVTEILKLEKEKEDFYTVIKNRKKQRNNIIITGLFPLLILSGAPTYLLLPDTYQILEGSHFVPNFWNFDVFDTFFVVIFLSFLFLFAYNIVLLVRLVSKKFDFKNED